MSFVEVETITVAGRATRLAPGQAPIMIGERLSWEPHWESTKAFFRDRSAYCWIRGSYLRSLDPQWSRAIVAMLLGDSEAPSAVAHRERLRVLDMFMGMRDPRKSYTHDVSGW